MVRRLFIFAFFTIILSPFIQGQTASDKADMRFQEIKNLLDYRFVGGFYTFESMFNKTVKYPEEAKQKCVIGITILSFQVDCNGNIKDIEIRNPLGYGIDKEVTKFIKSTKGHWNSCQNNRFTHFSIPIQFTMEGTKTDSINAAIVFEGENPGFVCYSDNYFLKKGIEALKKKKGRKAKFYFETLIRRNPFDANYYSLLKQSIGYTKKKKSKSKKQ